jgi:hypothetical protein
MFLEGRAPRKKGKREDVLEKLASILTERVLVFSSFLLSP